MIPHGNAQQAATLDQTELFARRHFSAWLRGILNLPPFAILSTVHVQCARSAPLSHFTELLAAFQRLEHRVLARLLVELERSVVLPPAEFGHHPIGLIPELRREPVATSSRNLTLRHVG